MQVNSRGFDNFMKEMYTQRKTVYHTSLASIDTAKRDEKRVFLVKFNNDPGTLHIYIKGELQEHVEQAIEGYLKTINGEEDPRVVGLLKEKINDWKHLKNFIEKQED
jgi:hypothetical protein